MIPWMKKKDLAVKTGFWFSGDSKVLDIHHLEIKV